MTACQGLRTAELASAKVEKGYRAELARVEERRGRGEVEGENSSSTNLEGGDDWHLPSQYLRLVLVV